MNKPDFKKWLENHDTGIDYPFPVPAILQKFINQFATDFAEKEAIRFLKWYEPNLNYMGEENHNELYQKFKDETGD